jgi:hypothetical protein
MKEIYRLGIDAVGRREVVCGALAMLLAGAVSTESRLKPRLRAASVQDVEPDLYAFPSDSPGKSVLAVTWRLRSADALAATRIVQARIHAGERTWTLPVSEVRSDVGGPKDAHRAFSGPIALAPPRRGAAYAAVAEVSDSLLLGQLSRDGGIWAQLIAADGSNHRVGSPLMSSLIATNASLRDLYRAAPREVPSALEGPVAKAISERVASGERGERAQAHARRLAQRLLPDVLAYNPTLACGFTFAGQNGRHPADDIDPVVQSVLDGIPRSGHGGPRWLIDGSFPFFRRPDEA